MAEQEAGSSATNWERQTLEKVALAAVQEQRRARHWGIVFKMLMFIYLFALLFVGLGWFSKKDSSPGKHSALVDLQGVISSSSVASAEVIMAGLQDEITPCRSTRAECLPGLESFLLNQPRPTNSSANR